MALSVGASTPVAEPARAPASGAAPGPNPAPGPPTAREGWQQRLEESSLGRKILSCLIVTTLVAIVAINLPESELRRQLLRPGQPFLNAIGVDQNWSLFAPDPRRVVIDVSATIVFDDGKTVQWSFPHEGALIGTYRDYRWRKWGENLINPANAAILWRPAALWAAAQNARPGHATTGVSLVERFAALAPPGVEPSVGPTEQRVFYALRRQSTGASK